MGVTELALETGVTAAAIRYYARLGLLSPIRNPDNNYRCFSWADRRRIQFIRKTKLLGLTITDIKALLEAADRGENISDMVWSKVMLRLQDIRQQLGDLEQTQARAAKALAAWAKTPSIEARAGEFCPLIERHTNRPAGADQSRAHAHSLR